jgi:hypothetical protein
MGPIPPRQRVLAKQVPQRTAVLSTAAAGRRHGRTSLPPAARNDRGTISLGAQAHVQWPSTRSCLAWRSFGSSTRKFPDVAGSDLPRTAASDCARPHSQAAVSARIAEFGRSGTRFKRAIRGQRLAPDGSTSRVRLQALTADLTRPGGRWAVSQAFCQARQSIMSQLERVAITADGSPSRSTPNRGGNSTRPITGFR